MRHIVDFVNVSTVGLESSPVAEALAGLRANEARYYKNKYDHEFAVGAASEESETLDWVSRILADERDIVVSSRLARWRRRLSRWRTTGWRTCSMSPACRST